MRFQLRAVFWGTTLAVYLSGCAYFPQKSGYQGPPERPAELQKYYEVTSTYRSFTEKVVSTTDDYTHKLINVTTDSGPISIDFYQRKEKTVDMIFVFPVLGGRNIVAEHFGEYFAEHGFDTAIVNRSNEFKDPKKFPELEEIFRKNVVRDRIAIDFFQNEYGKKTFGTFGISRGAINVAITAGVDPRLKYNVLTLGGTDLVSIFAHSDQRGVIKYLGKVQKEFAMTKKEVIQSLRQTIKTDPKNTAQYINARNTLLILAAFDHAVPIRYGEQLRVQMGKPSTVYVAGGHYTAVLYSQLKRVLLPWDYICLFPRDYIESEALGFYRKKMRHQSGVFETLPYRILQFPFSLIARMVHS